MQWKVWLAVGCGLTLVACGSSSRDKENSPTASCEPDSTFCQERQVWRCGDAGEEPTLVASCTAEEECSEDDGKAECTATCFAGRPTCDGDRATVCAADGSGPEPGGDACSEDGNVCQQGECVTPECTAGELMCYATDVYVCDLTGDAVALIDDCADDEVCEPERGVCAAVICETGTLACDGTKVVECNGSGTTWNYTAVDCADDDEVCFEGECLEPSCPPGAWACMEDGAFQCPDGLDWLQLQTCGANQHCVEGEDSSSAQCVFNDCLPGAPVCHMNVLKTCSEEGMYPEEGTDCGDDVCSVDDCHPVICDPGERICVDGDIHDCVSPGIRYMLSETCESGTICGSLAEEPFCVTQYCAPTEAACIGNTLGECGDDGRSLASVTEDCAVGGNVCDPSGACAAGAVDAIGISEDAIFVNHGEVVTNVIDVHSNRLVTEIEANLILNEPRDLRWVIAEWTGSEYEFLVNQITTNQQGSTFFSSGALAIELEEGKRYVLGVGVVATLEVEYIYYDMLPWDEKASFGTVLGGNRGFFVDGLGFYVEEDRIYAIQVTTALP